MLDSDQKRAAMIEHLEAALGLCDELRDAVTGYLIGCALYEARGYRFPDEGQKPRGGG